MASSTLLVLTVFPAYYVMVQAPRAALQARIQPFRDACTEPPGDDDA